MKKMINVIARTIAVLTIIAVLIVLFTNNADLFNIAKQYFYILTIFGVVGMFTIGLGTTWVNPVKATNRMLIICLATTTSSFALGLMFSVLIQFGQIAC